MPYSFCISAAVTNITHNTSWGEREGLRDRDRKRERTNILEIENVKLLSTTDAKIVEVLSHHMKIIAFYYPIRDLNASQTETSI